MTAPRESSRRADRQMINYTERISRLMRDIVSRVPALSPIDLSEVLVFARSGRTHADGAFATCHCLNLPTSEPGYYFWRDRSTGQITRRSEWFVTKSPVVSLGPRRVSHLISFALPRFCDQSLRGSRKEDFYAGAEHWTSKLDTIVHELYHIDPSQPGIRRTGRADGSFSHLTHGPLFFEDVARMVKEYLASGPDPSMYDFLRHDFDNLTTRFGEVVGLTFRSFPSYPQRYIEALSTQPQEASLEEIRVEPVKRSQRQVFYTEEDLELRRFDRESTVRVRSRVPGREFDAQPVLVAGAWNQNRRRADTYRGLQ